MGAFGSISLANKFGIVLSCLIFLTFCAGLARLWWNKRKLRHNIRLADAESRSPSAHSKKETARNDDPRYLFGVRAIERGHFGGVAQVISRPSSTDNLSTQYSDRTSPPMSSVDGQISYLEKQQSSQTSPLRLQPVTQPMESEVLPALTKPKPVATQSPVLHTVDRGVIDTNLNSDDISKNQVISATNSRRTQSRPTSFLPRISFPEPLGENLASSLLAPASSSLHQGRKSYRVFKGPQAPLSAVVEVPSTSPWNSTFSEIPIPPKSALRPSRTLWPRENPEKPKTRKPNTYYGSVSHAQVCETPSIIAMAAAQVNASRFLDVDEKETVIEFVPKRKSSDAISLAALTGTPVQSYFPTAPVPKANYPLPPPSPPTTLPGQDTPSSRGRRSTSTSTARERQSSSRSVSRARDSVHYLANSSRARSTSTSNRRSVQRYTLHYDPRPANRNRSGSIQGRAIDFSQPRETPFVTRNTYTPTVKGHGPSDSTSTDNSIMSYYTTSRSERSSQMSHFDHLDSLPQAPSSKTSHPISNPFDDDAPVLPIMNNNDTPRSSSAARHKLSDSLSRLQEEENLKRSGTLSVANVERRRPQRVSSHGGEWEIDVRPGFARIGTGSTSTSPVAW